MAQVAAQRASFRLKEHSRGGRSRDRWIILSMVG